MDEKKKKKPASQQLTVLSKLNKFQKDDVFAFRKKYREDFPEVIPPVIVSFVTCCTL